MTSPSTERRSPQDSSFCHPGAHEAFDLDVLLRALAHPCRREVLCLLDAQSTWTTSELAANLGTVESVQWGVTGQEAELALYHWHLPVLEEAGLVAVEEESSRVERGENFEPIRAMVDAAVSTIT